MGKLILFILLLFVGFTSLVRPWVGVASYYFLAILGPQYIWWYSFEGIRASLVITISTIIGLLLQSTRKFSNYIFIKTKLNYTVLFLWTFIVISYFFGPYISNEGTGGLSSSQIFSNMNKFFIFYFCSSLLINNLKHLHYLNLACIISILYLIFWANQQYFSQNWAQFNQGRLMGPFNPLGGSIYNDENVFAAIFVAGLPFLYFKGFMSRIKWHRIFLWISIPFGLHAIFLTGSRGALLGIGAITLMILLMNKRKFLAIPMLILLFAFYQWQAGPVMTERSILITEYEKDNSATDRLTAWKGGLLMAISHPLTGVGLASFSSALPQFIDHRPMVAHNTLIQFTAESGLGAGICYLLIIYFFYKNFFTVKSWCKINNDHEYFSQITYLNNASMVSFSGFIFCSIFLSLNVYEFFFFLLLFSNSLSTICKNKILDKNANHL